jgi:hypothetical protein
VSNLAAAGEDVKKKIELKRFGNLTPRLLCPEGLSATSHFTERTEQKGMKADILPKERTGH